MRLSYFLNILICTSIISCSEPEENQEVKCDTYFLYTIGSSTSVHYNLDGLISEYIMGSDTAIKFQYNDNNQLKVRWGLGGYALYYYYDDVKRLKYLLDYHNDALQDSITIEYNSESSINEIKHYTYLNFVLQLTKKNEYEYTGKNSTTVRLYELDNENLPNLKLTSTFLYEFDNNPVPFPKETWPFYCVFDIGAISQNNPVKQILRREGQPDSENIYYYTYNSGGYPTQVKYVELVLQEFKYSCEPRLRGQSK